MKRIARIRMVPFGVLPDVTVDLSPGLTVVYGANEAGKSTLLNALNATVTGMPNRAVHGVAPSHLRIDVTIVEETSGDTTERMFRRGIQGFLRYPDMTPDTCPWEAAVSGQPGWLTSHGMTHAQLRAGGQELFIGAGDLADVVFEAHEGFSARDVLAQLQTRSEKLFTKDGRSRSEIQEKLKRIQALEDSYKQEFVDSDTIERLLQDVKSAEQEAEKSKSDREDARRRAVQAQADRTAYPDIQEAVATRSDIEQAQSSTVLAQDVIEHVHAFERTIREQSVIVDDLSTTIVDLTAAIRESPAQDTILGDAVDVPMLHATLKAAVADRTEAEGARRKAKSARADARSALAQLGIHVSGDDPAETRAACLAVHLADDVISGINAVVDAHKDASDACSAAAEAMATTERDLQAHDHDHPSSAEGADLQTSGLATARQERDQTWQGVRESLLNPQSTSPDTRKQIAERFGDSVLRADQAADAAIMQARTDATRAGLVLAHAHASSNATRTRTALDAAEREWTALAQLAGLPPAVSPAGWPQRRTTIQLLAAHLDAWGRHRDKAREYEGKWRTFEEQVGVVAQRYSVVGSTEEQVRHLYKRLSDAQKDEKSLQRDQGDLAQANTEIEKARELLRDARAQLDDVMSQHQIVGAADLATRLANSEHYWELCVALNHAVDRLKLAYGRSERLIEDAFERLGPLTQQEVDDAAEGAKRVADDLDKVLRDRYDELTKVADKLRTAQEADNDVIRAQELKNARADLAEGAEEFAVATIQARLLARYLEQLFNERGSSTLIRAGELLEQLTGGRYVALSSVEGLAGQRSLRVTKRDQGDCELAELSEGTADQAFLALRLAGLETRHLRQSTAGVAPAPIVLDDVLLTFDDERTEQALVTLKEWAVNKQVILTTHHERVRDMASRMSIDCTELPSPVPFEALGTTDDIRQFKAKPQFA